MTEAAASPDSIQLVSHFHWDREWYRTMQGFRARLVDAVDQVLDLADADPDFRFLLDGQTIVLDDYLEARPDERGRLTGHIRAGRLAIGPWYVQPDSLLPSGEAHVRNLLEGRRTAQRYGSCSTVAYVPDSFGHPAQFPQLFGGFGLEPFVYWRGNTDESAALGARWTWRAPDGTAVAVHHLTEGYFGAGRAAHDVDEAVARLTAIVARQTEAGEHPVILMNGYDHTRPDPHTGPVAAGLAAALGRPVVRAHLDEATRDIVGPGAGEYRGELVGGVAANLLAGVWSTRMPQKIRNRRCETLLQRWLEPWAVFARDVGLPDEAPARVAWRSLLQNQAHDSICGCSADAVHRRMEARYDDAEGLTEETLRRVLERIAGRDPDRETPSLAETELSVFNSSPLPTSGVVRVPLDAHPAFVMSLGELQVHPLVSGGATPLGVRVDDRPARLVATDDPTRVRWLPDQVVYDIEFVARDVPAFGHRRYAVALSAAAPDEVDDGREIHGDDVSVRIDDDGTATVTMGDAVWPGLLGAEDVGDRGDSYDFDLAGAPLELTPSSLEVTRRRHPAGIERLDVRRTFAVPGALAADRRTRSEQSAQLVLDTRFEVARGVPGVRVRVRLANTARDHRLRLRFPTGSPVDGFRTATTFDEALRSTAPVDDRGWVHPASATFCHQGAVTVNGLTVVAPGLPEAEVRPDGELLLTLVRSVGWLARFDLDGRPMPAGPAMEVVGAQCLGEVVTDLRLLPAGAPMARRRRRPELRGVVGGPAPRLADAAALLSVEPTSVELSAVKPAEDGDGVIVRVLNPTDGAVDAMLELGYDLAAATSCRLDEEPDGRSIDPTGQRVRLRMEPHEIRSVRLIALRDTPST
ncbi:MAG: glycosyl hydrolase-related protein [Acidimicrobiales bacterium]